MRRLVEWATGIAWLRKMSARFADRRFAKWRKANPDRNFADFYAADVMAKINRGEGHPTLGGKGFKAGQNRTVAWDREAFAARGAEQWKFYAKVTGTKAGKRCVDFGCGSVRVGQHAIRDLNAGNYWGLDVTDHFYESGKALIDPVVLESKLPRFSIICDESLTAVRAWGPDAIFANAVLQHVPQPELRTFFQRLGAIMLPGAVAAIVFIGGPSIERVKAMSWAYPDDVLLEGIIEADDALEAEFSDIDGDDADAFNGRRRLLRIRRPAKA